MPRPLARVDDPNMARTTSPTSTLSLATLTLVGSLALACGETHRDTPTYEATPTATPAPSPTSSATAAPTPSASAPIELAHDAPALPASNTPSESSESSVLASATTTIPAAPERPSTQAQIPLDIPEANALAFASIRTKHDKPVVGGIGASGIHLDELEVGKGWAKSRCEDPTRSFAAGTDERVSVCFRVVHPKVDEQVSVEWSFGGKLRTTTHVGVRPTHAYLTRAWLPVAPGRAGEWTATIKSEDGSLLGAVTFEITK